MTTRDRLDDHELAFRLLAGLVFFFAGWAGSSILSLSDDADALIEQRCSDQAYYDQLPETVERPVLTLECE